MSNTTKTKKTRAASTRDALAEQIVSDAYLASSADENLARDVRSFIVADTRYKTYDKDKRKDIAKPVYEKILKGLSVRDAKEKANDDWKAYHKANKAFTRFWQRLDDELNPPAPRPAPDTPDTPAVAEHETLSYDPTGRGLDDSVIGHIVQTLNYAHEGTDTDMHAFYVDALSALRKALKVKPAEIK